MDVIKPCADRSVITLELIYILCYSVTFGFELKNTHVTIYKSYSLTEYVSQSVTDSEISCAVECLAKRAGSHCVAYQWDAETGSCQMQGRLSVTKSDGNTIGVITNDCQEILNVDPDSQSGVYNLFLGTEGIRQVWCDMDTDGGGWTVFLQRLDGSVDFNLNRVPYQQGFGNVRGEYWLGLDALHFLTSSKTYQLRADISDWEGASVYSLYSSMVIADETDNYRLTLGAFLGGEGGNALGVNNGSLFSTKDADMDSHATNHCSREFKGGFWYNRCLIGNPTGKYYIDGPYTAPLHNGMQWRTWKARSDKYYSMKTLDLKIRP